MKISAVPSGTGRVYLWCKDGTRDDINQRDLTGTGKWNKSGSPYFNINLTEEQARELFNADWRVKKRGKDMKQLNKRGEPGKWVNSPDLDADLEQFNYILEPRVSYTGINPCRIIRIIPGKEQRELFFNSPDRATDISILNNDVWMKWKAVIRSWRNPDDGIITGYLEKLWVEVMQNEFDEEYADLPVYKGTEGLEDE